MDERLTAQDRNFMHAVMLAWDIDESQLLDRML